MCNNRGVIVISVKNALIDPMTLPFNLSTTKTISFLGYPVIITIPIPSLNTFGSFVFELCSGQTNRQANRRTRTSYPRWPTLSEWIIMAFRRQWHDLQCRCGTWIDRDRRVYPLSFTQQPLSSNPSFPPFSSPSHPPSITPCSSPVPSSSSPPFLFIFPFIFICIFGPQRSMQICYYYYYYLSFPSLSPNPARELWSAVRSLNTKVWGALWTLQTEPQPKIEFGAFEVKNLTSGENNFSDVYEELYLASPCLWQNSSPKKFLEHLLQRLYIVDAPG